MLWKRLFFVLLTFTVWMGSTILSFFAGAIVALMYENRPVTGRRPGYIQYHRPSPPPPSAD